MGHGRLLLAGCALATFAAATPAQATTTVDKAGGALLVTAAPGQWNSIDVFRFGGNYFVTDGGDSVMYAPGSGCVAAGDAVACSIVGVGQVVVSANDQPDSVSVSTPTFTRLDGGAGDDELDAGAVTATAHLIGGPGTDALTGGPSNDILDGGLGRDVLDGAGGRDRAVYYSSAVGVNVSLDGVANDGGPFEGDNALVENVTGSNSADVLTGDGGPNDLSGLNGPDILNGLGSDDDLTGGPGADVLNGADGEDAFYADPHPDGPDVFNGGAGDHDHVDYGVRGGRVVADLDGVADDGEPGAPGEGDNAKGDIEDLTGGRNSDHLTGNAAKNVIIGGPGGDNLNGLGNNDRLWGYEGDDDLDGGDGDDNLFGGDNDDYIMGGPGSDGLRGENDDDFLAGPRDGAGDSLHGGYGIDECGGDDFDSKISCQAV